MIREDNNITCETQVNKPTLEAVAQSRPLRGPGAPSRTRSHYARILALLRERGPAGVLSSELYDAPQLFGRSPRNRISEMRADGHLIQTAPAGASVVRYILTNENPSPTPRPAPRKAEQQPLKSWDEVIADRERKLANPEPFELVP